MPNSQAAVAMCAVHRETHDMTMCPWHHSFMTMCPSFIHTNRLLQAFAATHTKCHLHAPGGNVRFLHSALSMVQISMGDDWALMSVKPTMSLNACMHAACK